MAIEHRLIPDAERHEPKGISTATAGQVYRSNGNASGSWKDDIVIVSCVIDDVSTSGDVLLPIPIDCTIISVKAVLEGAITVANSTISITRGGGDSLGSFIVPFASSAEGTTVNFTPVSNTSFVASTHNYLKFATDGGSTDAQKLFISVALRVGG